MGYTLYHYISVIYDVKIFDQKSFTTDNFNKMKVKGLVELHGILEQFLHVFLVHFPG